MMGVRLTCGTSRLIFSTSCKTCRATSTVLVPDCLRTPTCTPGFPFTRMIRVIFFQVSSTRAMS